MTVLVLDSDTFLLLTIFCYSVIEKRTVFPIYSLLVRALSGLSICCSVRLIGKIQRAFEYRVQQLRRSTT